MMRWAMIWNEGTSLSRCQYTGTRPQTTKVDAVTSRPRRCPFSSMLIAFASLPSSTPPHPEESPPWRAGHASRTVHRGAARPAAPRSPD
ncbi:hypothetical protein G6F40_015695 [Rhizopus arrhizus]|nr:hypothetical protein G6F40_015695 [Rhizopus arrhizus]